MSGKKSNAAKKAGNTKNTQYGKSAQIAKNTQKAKTKSAAQKKASKKILWLSIALCISLALNIVLIVLLAVGNKGDSGTNNTSAGNISADASDSDMFSYSDGIDENGFWEDTAALDYVELFDYLSFVIPGEIHEISDDDIQSEIRSLVENYTTESRPITDRAVIDGDTVNIDYVGSVDGVEFSGGSTGGGGTDVTAGSTDYIDDFLTQIIGHMPGETFNVEVTFPDVYENNPDLAGKDALFVTTINYILEYDADYGITDGFVEENLYVDYGWKTVAEMEEGISEGLQRAAIENYVKEFMVNELTYNIAPDYIILYQERLIEFQENDMLDYYQYLADSYEMDLDSVLQYFAGVSSLGELIEQNRSGIENDIKRSLAVQAIAEDVGISVSDEDMEYYLPEYSSYEEQYGMPWLKQYVLGLKVLDYIIENAVFA